MNSLSFSHAATKRNCFGDYSCSFVYWLVSLGSCGLSNSMNHQICQSRSPQQTHEIDQYKRGHSSWYSPLHVFGQNQTELLKQKAKSVHPRKYVGWSKSPQSSQPASLPPPPSKDGLILPIQEYYVVLVSPKNSKDYMLSIGKPFCPI